MEIIFGLIGEELFYGGWVLMLSRGCSLGMFCLLVLHICVIWVKGGSLIVWLDLVVICVGGGFVKVVLLVVVLGVGLRVLVLRVL